MILSTSYTKNSTPATNSGPNVAGINIASATIGIYLASIGIKTYVIKRFYNFFFGKKSC